MAGSVGNGWSCLKNCAQCSKASGGNSRSHHARPGWPLVTFHACAVSRGGIGSLIDGSASHSNSARHHVIRAGHRTAGLIVLVVFRIVSCGIVRADNSLAGSTTRAASSLPLRFYIPAGVPEFPTARSSGPVARGSLRRRMLKGNRAIYSGCKPGPSMNLRINRTTQRHSRSRSSHAAPSRADECIDEAPRVHRWIRWCSGVASSIRAQQERPIVALVGCTSLAANDPQALASPSPVRTELEKFG